MRFLAAASVMVLLVQAAVDDEHHELAWVDRPESWHQQAIRIVDHPFSTLEELLQFGLAAKKAGVSVVELVGPHKTSSCVGYWYAQTPPLLPLPTTTHNPQPLRWAKTRPVLLDMACALLQASARRGSSASKIHADDTCNIEVYVL